MRLKDIWPTLGEGYAGGDKPQQPVAGKCTRGVSHGHRYFTRYTNVLSAWIAERNLRKISERLSKKMSAQ